MTIALVCNVSDGVVMGVDAAVTVPAPGGIAKVYENAEKLFALKGRPVGMAGYGLGSMADRSIGSYFAEFEAADPDGHLNDDSDLSVVVESIRLFLHTEYMKSVVPQLEAATKKKFKNLRPEQIPNLGVVLGGFSPGEYLSEVWNIRIPHDDKPSSATQTRKPGQFGTNWFAMYAPIQRYFKGYDENLLKELMDYLLPKLGKPLTKAQEDNLKAKLAKHEYQVPYGAMPLQEAVDHVKFLAELMINHHRFVAGAPVVGGRVALGKVSYRGERFEILNSSGGVTE